MKLFAIALTMGAAFCATTLKPLNQQLIASDSEVSNKIASLNIERELLGGDKTPVFTLSPSELQGYVADLVKPLKWTATVEGSKTIISEKAGQDEVKILEVLIVEPTPGKKSVEMSNIDSDRFPAFKNNHALYSHGIAKTDTEAKLKAFIEQKLKLFADSAKVSKAKSVKTICEDMKSLASSEFGHKVTLNQPKDHFCIVEVKRGSGDANAALNPIVCHIRVHNINEEMVGINVVQIDREYEARVPKHNYDENVAEVKNVIKDILGQKADLPISIQKAVKDFSQAFAKHCNKKDPGLKNLIQEGEIFGATIDLGAQCAFANTKIFIEQFNYGYLQYMHIVIDHSILRAEYMIGIDPKVFNKNLEGVLDELENEIKTTTELRKNSKQDHPASLELIKNALTEAMPGFTVTLEDKVVSVKQEDVEVCRSIESTDGAGFVISFFTPFGKTPEGASNPELFIEAENGFDQMEKVKEHAKKFVEGIKLI